MSDKERDNWIERVYINPMIDKGYERLDNIKLPDGRYYYTRSGYEARIMHDLSSGGVETGYCVITRDGIRGRASGWVVVENNKFSKKARTFNNFFAILYKNIPLEDSRTNIPAKSVFSYNQDNLSHSLLEHSKSVSKIAKEFGVPNYIKISSIQVLTSYNWSFEITEPCHYKVRWDDCSMLNAFCNVYSYNNELTMVVNKYGLAMIFSNENRDCNCSDVHITKYEELFKKINHGV